MMDARPGVKAVTLADPARTTSGSARLLQALVAHTVEHCALDIRLKRQHLWAVAGHTSPGHSPEGVGSGVLKWVINHGAWAAVIACSTASERKACICGMYPGGRGLLSRLRGFAALGMPKRWRSVPADHPFLSIEDDRIQSNGAVRPCA